MEIILSILIGYALGCINPAYFFAKAKGFDIRTRGTKSAGASNAKTTMGWKYGIICAIYDISKSIIAMLIIKYLVKDDTTLITIAGCSAVIGHIFPFYLNFKGGKGFASIEVIIASTIVSLVILFKHAVNFKRILQKDEIGINGKKTGINLLKKEEA